MDLLFLILVQKTKFFRLILIFTLKITLIYFLYLLRAKENDMSSAKILHVELRSKSSIQIKSKYHFIPFQEEFWPLRTRITRHRIRRLRITSHKSRLIFWEEVIAIYYLRLKVSSKKILLFSRYSNFCIFCPSFLYFPDSKGHIKVE